MKYGIIYKVENIQNRKIYIGQTIKSLDERKYEHIYQSIKKDSQYYFHKAIRKYGKDSFRWNVICKCNNIDELNDIEIKQIKKHNSNNCKYGYNLDSGGSNAIPNKEIKNKISQTLKGHITSDITKQKIRNSLKGNIPWNKGQKIGKVNISKDVRKRKSQLLKKQWKDNNFVNKIKNATLKANSKQWIVIEPNGKEIVVDRLVEFCKKNNLCDRNMRAVANKTRNSHKGWKCKYSI